MRPRIRYNTRSRISTGRIEISSNNEPHSPLQTQRRTREFSLPRTQTVQTRHGERPPLLPKLGWMRLRLSRQVLGELRNITVSLRAGRWYASIQTAREVEQPIPNGSKATGIDVGIKRFATFSDGSFLVPLNSFRQHEQRLARYQRRMARKVVARTGTRPRRRFNAFTPRLRMFERIFSTKPLPQSANSTRWWCWKT